MTGTKHASSGKKWLARRLWFFADRISPETAAFRCTSLSFYLDPGTRQRDGSFDASYKLDPTGKRGPKIWYETPEWERIHES